MKHGMVTNKQDVGEVKINLHEGAPIQTVKPARPTDRPHSSLGYKPFAPIAVWPSAFMQPYYGKVAA